MSVSANLIVRNEEKRLEILLPILRTQVDEIILVDQESGDNTVAIAEKYCDKVITDKCTGFADSSRGLCMDESQSDWILTIDADEFLTTKFADVFDTLDTETVDGFMIHIAIIRTNNRVNVGHILGFAETMRNYNHKSCPYQYRLYKKGEVVIGNKVHSGIGPKHGAIVKCLRYNGIIEIKNSEEEETDVLRYKAIIEGNFDPKVHI